MADSWRRLTEGKFLPIDVQLLKHELAEAWYMKQFGPSYKDAHDRATLKYPSPY
jgi:hypothetical protein